MTGFSEPRPDLVSPTPGGSDDPLGESVLDPAQPWLRIYQPRDVRLVIGRHQDPERELLIAQAQDDRVPIHRRVSGGGAVVLAPGMVVVALRLRNTLIGTTCYFELVNSALAPAVTAACGLVPVVRGHGDLAVEDEAGMTRKLLGASLRQTSRLVVYLGVFLVDDAVPLMARYLKPPSREPDYRGGRGHAAFCTHLARHGVAVPALCAALEGSCEAVLGAHALR
jgi:lipoate-protein ligase A